VVNVAVDSSEKLIHKIYHSSPCQHIHALFAYMQELIDLLGLGTKMAKKHCRRQALVLGNAHNIAQSTLTAGRIVGSYAVV
jgi:hypothetical protein